MLGLYILAFFIAIIVVVYWAKTNDAVPLGGKTTGILRMTRKDEAGPELANRTSKETAEAAQQASSRVASPTFRPSRD